MAEVPNADWTAERMGLQAAPFLAEWQRLNQPVIHIFTHIDLRMEIAVARLPATAPAPEGMRWVSLEKLGDEPLPTLFRKVIEAGLRALR
jgi:A/G-specific adenine glycosylase